MDFRFTRTETHKISLTDDEMKEIAIHTLKRMVSPEEYLRTENGKLVLKQDDPHWRHGSVSEEYVRHATDLDIAVFKVLEKLQCKN